MRTILSIPGTGCECSAGSGMPLPYNSRCGRRSATKPTACMALSERRYTPYFGVCHFNGGRYGTAVPSRDCTPRALPRAARSGRHVGLRPPRNDNSGAFAILTAVCTDCKCVAGPGCPLPYNGRCGRRSATKPAACKALRERRYRRKLPKCSRAGYRGRRTGRSWQWGRALCRAAFSTGNGRRQGPPAQEASGYPAQGHHRGA